MVTATTTIRVPANLRKKIHDIAHESGESMQQVLNDAVDLYERKKFLATLNEEYAALRADPNAWQDFCKERAEWDVTLMDGLEEY